MIAVVREVHDLGAWVLIGSNAAVGAWCLAAHRWPQIHHRAIWVAVIVAHSTAFIQAVVGALLAQDSSVPLDDMHALYGFSAIIAVMIMYSYRTSSFLRDNQLVLYGLGSWFIMGLGLRNLVLG